MAKVKWEVKRMEAVVDLVEAALKAVMKEKMAGKAVATARHCMLTAARRAARASRKTDCALASSPVTDDRTVRREAKRRNVGREVA